MGFHAKVERAKKHLDDYTRSIAAFSTAPGGYTISREEHPAGDGKIAYVFQFHLKNEPPYVAWALLIGDCIHNLRSALDHLFWALLLQQHPDGKVQHAHRAVFPICRDAGQFNGRRPNLTNWVGADVVASLELAQPYQFPEPERHPLRFINDCDISDKHKLLLPSIHVLHAGAVEFVGSGTFHGHSMATGPLADGEEFARVLITPASPNAIKDVKVNTTVKVFFQNAVGGWEPSTETLEILLKVVKEVGDDFGALLQK